MNTKFQNPVSTLVAVQEYYSFELAYEEAFQTRRIIAEHYTEPDLSEFQNAQRFFASQDYEIMAIKEVDGVNVLMSIRIGQELNKIGQYQRVQLLLDENGYGHFAILEEWHNQETAQLFSNNQNAFFKH